MTQRLSGLKIRAIRKAQGLTQAGLARRICISAPYLNLIEGNRRPVSEGLLARIADALGIAVAELDGSSERRLVQALQELTADPRFAPAPGGTEDFVGRHPQWAELILRLFQAYEDRHQAVLALADRLNHDPFLGENVHQLLTTAASLSSAAEILAGEDLSVSDRQRFGSIVRSDGERFAARASELLRFFDNSETRVRSATPSEHVDAFILAENNHFPDLEALADEHRPRFGIEGAVALGIGEESMWPESRRFARMREFARDVGGRTVADIVRQHPTLPSADARRIAEAALYSYLTAAMIMPYDAFLSAAADLRYDIDALCRHFEVSYEQAAHRLATLRRPAAEGVQLAFMRSDVSGHVTKRLPIPGLPLPRYATSCPKWVIYEAFQTPGRVVRQFGELPSGERFLFFARAVDKLPPRMGHPRRLMAVMLACPAEDAGHLVYGDGLDERLASIPIGTVCRLCSRDDCGYRQEEALIGAPDQRRMAATDERM